MQEQCETASQYPKPLANQRENRDHAGDLNTVERRSTTEANLLDQSGPSITPGHERISMNNCVDPFTTRLSPGARRQWKAAQESSSYLQIERRSAAFFKHPSHYSYLMPSPSMAVLAVHLLMLHFALMDGTPQNVPARRRCPQHWTMGRPLGLD